MNLLGRWLALLPVVTWVMDTQFHADVRVDMVVGFLLLLFIGAEIGVQEARSEHRMETE